MKLNEFRSRLLQQPGLTLTITLPDGQPLPAHFHITEVGRVTKRFVDCGGTRRELESCTLQAWTGRSDDDGHRLSAGKLAAILDVASDLLSPDDLPVEVEFENGVVSQYPLVGADSDGQRLLLRLGLKHTDCLAREKCGVDQAAEVAGAQVGGCCGGTGCCG